QKIRADHGIQGIAEEAASGHEWGAFGIDAGVGDGPKDKSAERAGQPEDEAGEGVGQNKARAEKNNIENRTPSIELWRGESSFGCRVSGGSRPLPVDIQHSTLEMCPEQVQSAKEAEENAVLFHQKGKAEEQAAGGQQ